MSIDIIPQDDLSQGQATLTSTSAGDVIAAASGQSHYVYQISGSNGSGTFVRVDIRDGTTVKRSFWLAPNGGGFSITFAKPWKLTAGNALTAILSTTPSGNDVRVGAAYITK